MEHELRGEQADLRYQQTDLGPRVESMAGRFGGAQLPASLGCCGKALDDSIVSPSSGGRESAAKIAPILPDRIESRG